MNFNPQDLKVLIGMLFASLTVLTIQHIDLFADSFNYITKYTLNNNTEYLQKYNLMSVIEYSINENIKNYKISLARKHCNLNYFNDSHTLELDCPIKFENKVINNYINYTELFYSISNPFSGFLKSRFTRTKRSSSENYLRNVDKFKREKKNKIFNNLNSNSRLNVTIDLNNNKSQTLMTLFQNEYSQLEFIRYIAFDRLIKRYKSGNLKYDELITSINNLLEFDNTTSSNTYISDIDNLYKMINVEKLYIYLDLLDYIKNSFTYNLYRSKFYNEYYHRLTSANLFMLGTNNLGSLLDVNLGDSNIYNTIYDKYLFNSLSNIKFDILDMLLE
jgi:hypothetical protein